MPTLMEQPRHPLLYVLHSGKLYGTERMALATVRGLADQFEPILFAPPGPALDEAERLGFTARRFRGGKQFARELRPFLKRCSSLTFVATGVVQSAACIALNLLYRRRINHVHIVHGGTDERESYGRKKWLNHANVRFVTVSDYARERMIANGVRADRIEVVWNFLPPQQIAQAPRRPPFTAPGIRNVLMISRLDPLKRVDLLLDALDRHKEVLRDLSFRVLGSGADADKLIGRAKASHPNVEFVGFTPDVPAELARADLLLHTCPTEPFGLAILEAMAARVPVLVPDRGGAASLIEQDVSGRKFRANDADDLARQLQLLRGCSADALNRLVAGGTMTVEKTFSAETALKAYRRIFAPN